MRDCDVSYAVNEEPEFGVWLRAPVALGTKKSPSPRTSDVSGFVSLPRTLNESFSSNFEGTTEEIQVLVLKNLKILSVMNGKDPSVHEGRVPLPRPVVFGERVIVNQK